MCSLLWLLRYAFFREKKTTAKIKSIGFIVESSIDEIQNYNHWYKHASIPNPRLIKAIVCQQDNCLSAKWPSELVNEIVQFISFSIFSLTKCYNNRCLNNCVFYLTLKFALKQELWCFIARNQTKKFCEVFYVLFLIFLLSNLIIMDFIRVFKIKQQPLSRKSFKNLIQNYLLILHRLRITKFYFLIKAFWYQMRLKSKIFDRVRYLKCIFTHLVGWFVVSIAARNRSCALSSAVTAFFVLLSIDFML